MLKWLLLADEIIWMEYIILNSIFNRPLQLHTQLLYSLGSTEFGGACSFQNGIPASMIL